MSKPEEKARKARAVPYHDGLIERLKDEEFYNLFIEEIRRDAREDALDEAIEAVHGIRGHDECCGYDRLTIDYAHELLSALKHPKAAGGGT